MSTDENLTNDFRYDVFISYRQQEPDKNWVREILVPRLEAADLKICIDFRNFRLGSPLVTEMTRAVEESHYTLMVLSPSYLKSNFTEFENILAEHLGLEKGERRLIAIMREPCKPNLRIRARLWLDMVNDDDFHANIQRLIFELETPIRGK